MNRYLHILFHVLKGTVAIAGFGFVIMLLWNALVPSVLGVAAINFWQALGLFALCRILFGSFGCGFQKFAGRNGYHRNHFREKWHNMSDEERREFIKNRHFGFGHGFDHDFFDNKSGKKD
ncbi:MAG: hypothetical protein LBH60_04740 [Prevotellaceae bacterium]|jgi:ABC-type uncharacterized transport system fused permease/ATPase subunit|nr:hypothetical protein [Prevotellaceae bacterium]